MSTLVALHHLTHYHYDRNIKLGPQIIRLRPAPHTRSAIQSYSLKILPKQHFINWQQDPFGNYQARIVIPEKTNEFRIEVDLVTEISTFNPFDFFLEETAKFFPFSYDASLKEELRPYLEIKENGPLLKNQLATININHQGMIDFLVAINQQFNQQLKYLIRLEPGVQSCEETLQKASGSCRDMAWLLCQILRHFDLATRFTSGYLIQLKADIPALEGPRGAGEDFTDLHAWCEVYLPGAGWVGLDPTSGLFAGEGHIPLCCTANPSSAAPISGVIEPCQSTLDFSMHVIRVHEDRRVTKPFHDEEWDRINQLAEHIDQDLQKHDVRLTMGGEPTFISLENMQGAAWQFSALSEDKYALGKKLIQRLKAQFAPQGILQFSQGKWYPGEILPRWAMHCYWRKDGEPLWQDSELLADTHTNAKIAISTLKQFLETLAQKLCIPKDYVLPAYEDTFYYQWKEQRTSQEQIDVMNDEFEMSERKRLETLREKNLTEPVGYVLPVYHSPRCKRWISNRWSFKDNRLVLTTGDSPLGLRLPLNTLPNPDISQEEQFERNPFEQTDPLHNYNTIYNTLLSANAPDDNSFKQDPNGLIKTALCAEVRQGRLFLFLPPLTFIEHFLELIIAIEITARELKLPVILEGYPPPQDIRLQNCGVTPDPGVLEVNIPPASNWQELQKITNTIYEEARLLKLTTERFLVDGRRVGTGGGNHIVTGGATPDDSPWLRRPDLLRSLVTFWQNHPSLSYLFSSINIGPTSQAPRIDEARHDALYELEIAYKHLPEERNPRPWLVDRLFRNLLVDITGNTHRAEFCIDKLYNPESPRGQLGLVEMRGFEMTPHPQMNLVQALLIRAIIASCWQKPYQHKFIYWGTQLHDRFMLPHYVWEDFQDVLDFLAQSKYFFQAHWFEPFLHFRFPVYGKTQIGEITLELRMALEPWPVLGEEMFSGSVSRAVDSSLERLQVKVNGAIEGRHIITCNGFELPLQPTAKKNVFVAGVRYKAWAPPSCLHPTLPIHTPLVFDVVDSFYQRSLGGCTYHVTHPGGRHYKSPPINENEAEGRRLSRFQAMGHTPGKFKIKRPATNAHFPYTLDLRRENMPNT